MSKKKISSNLNSNDIFSIHNSIIAKTLEQNKNLNEKYINLTKNLFEEFRKVLNTPIKTSFIKHEKKVENTEEINSLINKYLLVVNNFFSNNDEILAIIKKFTKCNTQMTSCECGNSTDFQYKYNLYRVCENCGRESDYVICTVENSTYNDLQQINLNQRYKYEKICHFRDTVNQFQAKQNKNIPDKVYNDLEDMIEKHDLLIKSGTTKREKYAKITKQHIRDFLHETNNNKYYEDIQLLWCKITDNSPPNITNLEKSLYEDFERLVDAFLSIPDTNRKNFLNSQYVLKQLLRRYDFVVKDTDINMLKTPSRLREHDEIYEKCCDILHWNFQPL